MEELKDENASLKRRLEEAEKNTVLAATYGKQLLQENQDMHGKLEETVKDFTIKIEALEQEKYSVKLKLEAKTKDNESLRHDLQRLSDKVDAKVKEIEKELERRSKELEKECRAKIQELEIENLDKQQQAERIAQLEAQLQEAQERIDDFNTSIHDVSTDETTANLQSQIMTLTCDKQDLATQVSGLKSTLNNLKLKGLRDERLINSQKEEIETLECQATSNLNTIEKMKEEIEETKAEVEAIKLGQTDPGKKGNSLFAEVEDNRQAMETQMKEYKSKYNVLKSQYDVKTQQISKMKMQLANLISVSSNKVDAEYIVHLEESLSTARSQLEDLMKKDKEEENKQASSEVVLSPMPQETEDEGTEGQGMINLFKNLYIESQKKIDCLDEDLKSVQFEKVALSDRILQLQRKLRQVNSSMDTINSKYIQLQVKYEELALKKGENIGAAKKVKMVKESIPGFESATATSKEEAADENRTPLKVKDANVDKIKDGQSPPVKDGESKDMDKKEDSSKQEEENQENKPSETALEPKKKKKSVRMIEKVAVQEIDGENVWTFKVKDNQPSEPLRCHSLLEAIKEANLSYRKYEKGRHAFNIVTEESNVEDYFKPDNKTKFSERGFTVVCPPELKALKTIFVRGVSNHINQHTREDLKTCVEQCNQDVLVEEVMKISNSPKTLKIRFTSMETAKKVAKKGFKIMNQCFQSSKIQRETFVRVDPCRICYSYAHLAANCPTPDLIVCSECASKEHSYRECKSITKKCVNCDGNHRTLSAICPIRKSLARQKTISARRENKEKEKIQTLYADYFQLPPELISNVQNEVIAKYYKFCEQENGQKSPKHGKSAGTSTNKVPNSMDEVTEQFKKFNNPDQPKKKDEKSKQPKAAAASQDKDKGDNAAASSKSKSKIKKETPSASGATAAGRKPILVTGDTDGKTLASELGIRIFCSMNLKMQKNPRDEDIQLAALAGILKIVFGSRKFSRNGLIQRIKKKEVTFSGSEIEYCGPEAFNRLSNEDYIPKGLLK